jgi:mono/diheme cytochrome c family protein
MVNVKRWVGLIGLAVLVSVLVTGLMSGMALAQEPNPQPGNDWGPGMMNSQGSGDNGYGYWHHGMMNGWGYLPGITNTAPNGYCWGGNSWGAGMMRRPNSWGRHRGQGMWGGPRGYYNQQPGNWGGYIPQALPDDGNSPKPREEVSFTADIQPIFNTRCIACHNEAAGRSLSSYDAIMQSGMNGPVVISRDPANSRLIQYVQSGYMPLGGPPLSQAQAQTLVNWVAAGAPNN